jgi:calcium-dependent protein kinase
VLFCIAAGIMDDDDNKIGNYKVVMSNKTDLGRGFSGTVWKAVHVTTGQVVAAKRVELGENSPAGHEYNQKYVFNEIEILKSINHDNVIKLYDSERDDRFLYLFLELCKKGDLNKFIVEKKFLTKEQGFRFLVHISDALAYLHEHVPAIVHRDVKPDNMLVHGDDDANYKIKITDFSFSKRSSRVAAVFSTTVGTPQWMAPEVLPSKGGRVSYDMCTDVFSAGLVFLAIIDHEHGKLFVAFTGESDSLNICM